MVIPFEKVVPIIFREGNTVVNRNGDVTLCFRYEGPSMGTKTPSELDKLSYDFATAFTFLPDRTVVHKQDVYVNKKLKTEPEKEKDFFSRAYLKLYNEKKYMAHSAYIFVTRTSVLSLSRNYSTPLDGDDRSKQKNEDSGTTRTQREEIENLEHSTRGWIQFMGDSGMKLYPLTEQEMDDTIEGYLSLYDSGLLSDIDFENKRIGFKKFEVVSVGNGEQMPEMIRAERLNPDYVRFSKEVHDVKGQRTVGLYSDYLCRLGYGLKCEHVVNQFFFCDGKDFWNGEIERRKKNFGAWRFFSRENALVADALTQFEHDTLDHNEHIIRCHINVLYWTEEDSLMEIREGIRSGFKELGITGKVSGNEDVRSLYLAGVPGNGGVLPFEETFLGHASALAALGLKESILVKPFETKSMGLVFTDRDSGALIKRDCWFEPYRTKQITNRNFLGIGKTGSGKSSMTIEMIRQYLGLGFNCTVLDIGRSFEVLAKSHNGNYIIYEDGLGLGVNPFSFQGNTMSNSLLEFLAQFTAVLWKPNEELGDDEMNALEKVILAAYNGSRDTTKTSGFKVEGDFTKTTIKHLYSFVENNKKYVLEQTKSDGAFFNIDSFLLSIEKFVDGKFDRLFTDNNNIDESKNLTVWELDNVKDHKTLFPILSMLITYLTTEVIWKKTSQEKIVLIEEAWKMLEKPGMISYIKWLYKTIRKFDGAVGINIQQASDMVVPGTNIKETILANSDVKFIMSHSIPMAKELAEILGLDDYQLGLLLSIPLDEEKSKQSGKKRFSELISIVGNDVKALRLMVSKEQIVNFMSEMKDKEKLFTLVKEKKGNWKEAIADYAVHM